MEEVMGQHPSGDIVELTLGGAMHGKTQPTASENSLSTELQTEGAEQADELVIWLARSYK